MTAAPSPWPWPTPPRRWSRALPQDALVRLDAEPRLRRALAAAVPALAPAEVITTIAGVYDVTPDWHPMLGRGRGFIGLYLVGFSGHGLKLAPAVGQSVADELACLHARHRPQAAAPGGAAQAAALRLRARCGGLEPAPRIISPAGTTAGISVGATPEISVARR